MKTKMLLWIAATAGVLASPAFAVDLVNEDQDSYEVTVDDGQQVRTIVVNGSTTLPDICSKCLLSLGANDLQVGGTQVVTIRDASFMPMVHGAEPSN